MNLDQIKLWVTAGSDGKGRRQKVAVPAHISSSNALAPCGSEGQTAVCCGCYIQISRKSIL